LTQPLTALAVGNERRLQCFAARRRVHSAPDTAAGMRALADELEAGRTWPKALLVEEALAWPRSSQPRQRAALLAHAGCTKHATVAKLTIRQRGVLCHALRSPVAWKGRG
jgi:hypothetical protein